MLRELLGSHQQSHQASLLLRESVILVSYLLVVKGHAERTVRITSAVSPGLPAPERVCKFNQYNNISPPPPPPLSTSF